VRCATVPQDDVRLPVCGVRRRIVRHGRQASERISTWSCGTSSAAAGW
jgi:hypothetical protein